MPRHKAKHARVPEKVARPARTTAQGAVAAVLVALWSAKVHHLSRDEAGTALVVVTALVGALWVAIEDHLGVGLLRQVPPTTAPVVDDKAAP